jgi:large subunit ribosomal protein L21
MYAVIRAGGKQYRVAPGDVVRLETQTGSKEGKVEFGDVLAVSASAGEIVRPESGAGALVTGQILNEDRAKKILVFHYKKKKQYKKIAGHRQPFSAVRITEIAFDGKTYSAPELPKKEAKPKKVRAEHAAHEPVAAAHKAEAKAGKPAAKKKAAAPKKSAAKKSGTGKKK